MGSTWGHRYFDVCFFHPSPIWMGFPTCNDDINFAALLPIKYVIRVDIKVSPLFAWGNGMRLLCLNACAHLLMFLYVFSTQQ